MMLRNGAILLLLSILIGSCMTSTQMVRPNLNLDAIEGLDYFQPIAYVSKIDKKQEMKLSDEISYRCEDLIDSILYSKQEYKIKDKIGFSSRHEASNYQQELETLIEAAFITQNVGYFVLPPMIDSLMMANESEYAIGIFEDGFYRSKKNYRNQVLKMMAVGILSLGSAGLYYEKAKSTINMMIFDRVNGRVIMYRRSIYIGSPMEVKVLDKQLNKLLGGFWKPDF